MSAAGPSAAREASGLLQAGRLEEALPLAERAVDGARVCLAAHGLLATVLLRLGRVADAERTVTEALELAPGVADAYDGLAWVSLALGRHERSNELYRRATGLAPRDPRFWYNLACSERSFGRLADAEAACDRAIALDTAQYPSYLLRSEMRVQSQGSNHIGELQRLLAAPGADHRARMFLGYALGKELDDVGRFDEAFRCFAAAARVRRAKLAYDVAADERKLARIAECYTGRADAPSMPAAAPEPAGTDSSRYIFVVGLPRSGTTLIERILGGLAGVRSNGETDNFSRALLAHTRGTGDLFQQAAAADPQAVAAGYARLAEPGAAAERILEKLPLNYLYVGAIARALPGAKILLVSRSPLDSCFAMFRTLFGAGYPFSYDLGELARYYAAYARLMAHWRAVCGGRLHEISYEDLVRDPRGVGATIAGYCALSWSDTALDIQNNASVSLTASAAQIRRPIYGSSSGRWRHYRAHLEPLVAALRTHAIPLQNE